jgi:hypothetical protein
MFREKMKSMTQQQRDGRFDNIDDPGRRARMISTYEHGCESPFVEQGISASEKLLREMDNELASKRIWSKRGSRLAIRIPFAVRPGSPVTRQNTMPLKTIRTIFRV